MTSSRNAITIPYRLAGWLCLALCAVWIGIGHLIPWGIAIDFANFYDAGHKALVGEIGGLYNPFALIAGGEPVGHMTFYSAPLTSYLYAPMATLPPRTALFLFKIAGTLSLVMALMLLYRRLLPLVGNDATSRDRFFAAFALAVLIFQPFWTIYRVGGQTTPIVLLLFVCGLIAAQSGRAALAALLCAGAVLIKPAFAPAAITIFLLSSNRFRLAALIAGLTSVAASIWLFGWELHQQFLDLLRNETRKLLIPTLNSAPFAFIEPMLVEPSAFSAGDDAPAALASVASLLRGGSGLLLAYGLFGALRQGLADPARTWLVWTGGLVLSLTLSPVVWAHYLALAFPALATFIALARHFPRPARLHLALIFALSALQHRMVIAGLEARLGVDSVGALTAIGLVKSLPLLLLLGFLLLWRRQIVATLRDPAWLS